MSYLVFGCTEKEIVLQEVATESEAQKLASQFVKHEVHGFYVDSADFMLAMASILMCDDSTGYLVCERNACEDSKTSIRIVEKTVDIVEQTFDFDFYDEFYYDIAYAVTSNTPLVVFDVFLTSNGCEVTETKVVAHGNIITYDDHNHIKKIETPSNRRR